MAKLYQEANRVQFYRCKGNWCNNQEMSLHPKVSSKLSPWAQQEYSRWLYWKDQGNQPKQNELVEDELYRSLYDREFERNALNNWSKKQYLEFRKSMIDLTFETIHFSEVIQRLNRWNALFTYR